MDANPAAATGVSRSWAKFLIGFFAAACACFVPRLVALLAHNDPTVESFIPTGYAIGSAVLALLVGGVITLFEWNVPRAPSQTFMTALGIPALLAGSFNTAVAVGDTLKAAKEQPAGVRIEAPVSSEELSPLSVAPKPQAPSSSSLVLPSLIPSALAADANASPSKGLEFGFVYREPRYLVIANRTTDLAHARNKLAALQVRGFSSAQIVHSQTSNEYLIVADPVPQPRDAALRTARALREATGLQPSLLPLEPASNR
jgi:hypothetical protein